MTDINTLKKCSDTKQPCIPQASLDDFDIATMSSLHTSAYMMVPYGDSCHFIFYYSLKTGVLVIFSNF